jgi:hypothetical protein
LHSRKIRYSSGALIKLEQAAEAFMTNGIRLDVWGRDWFVSKIGSRFTSLTICFSLKPIADGRTRRS